MKIYFSGILDMELLMICSELEKDGLCSCYAVTKEKEIDVFDDEFINEEDSLQTRIEL